MVGVEMKRHKKQVWVPVCEWKLEDGDVNKWESACGEHFLFHDSSPVYNGFKFCPYCGKRCACSNDLQKGK